MIPRIKVLSIAAAAVLAATSAIAIAQEQDGKANQFLPIAGEPEAKLYVDQPLAEPLASRGTAIIPYRTENFRILPIFGAAANDVSPRVGHLHVTVDDLPWHWADASDVGSIVVAGLSAGEHKVLIEIATPDHKVISGKAVSFTVPAVSRAHH
ncbi:MAG: hypothetical protein JNK21_04935 [Rhodospirillaceae bacterium]|nr:hypothetical protein [Rhodospirillaceae bacterium]